MHELLNKEKRIMDIYWSANEPYLISDILKADPSLNRNTVAKALVSLEKKGYLKVDCIKRTSPEVVVHMFLQLLRKTIRKMNFCLILSEQVHPCLRHLWHSSHV